MNARRIGVLVGLDLRQRVRRPGFYVLLGIFFVVVAAVNALALIALSWMPSATSTRV